MPDRVVLAVDDPSGHLSRTRFPGPGERLRLLVGAGVASVFVSYLCAVLIAAVAGLTAGAGPAVRALLVTAIPLWLAAHQVPLVVAGAPLGVLPLLPTVGVLALVAAMASRLTGKLGSRPREDASAVVASLTGAHASAAVLATALPQSPVQATPWAALLGGAWVAGAGAVLGSARRTGLSARWSLPPGWLRGGLAAAGVAASALLTSGALMLLAALVVSVDDLHTRLRAAPVSGAGVGLALLSLCYLPNALVAAVSWVAGPGFSIGAAAASPLFSTPGALPPIPLMSAMPTARPPDWTAVVFVLPVLAGVLAGLRCRLVDPHPVRRLFAVAVAATAVAVGFGLAAWVISGRLAAGPFDPVDMHAPTLVVALLGWVGIPAAAVALSAGPSWRQPTRWRPRSGRASRSAVPPGTTRGTPSRIPDG